MKYGLSSLGGRFVWVTLAILALLMAITIYSDLLVGKSVRTGLATIEQNSAMNRRLAILKRSLQNIETSLFQHASFLDASSEKITNDQVKVFVDTLKELDQAAPGSIIASLRGEINQIQNEFSVLQKVCEEYFAIMRNVETRFPGMPYLLQYLEPNNRKFSQAVILALDEAELTDAQLKKLERKQYEVIRLFQEIRYAWSQQVSWLRITVANRMGAFGDPVSSMKTNLNNRNIFASEVKKLLVKLDLLAKLGELGLQQRESLEMMHEAADAYEENFDAAIKIYLSPNWRADVTLMEEKILPSINRLNITIGSLDKIINDDLSQSISKSYGISELLSNYIWIFFGGMLLVMGLGFYVFNSAIRKPVLEIATAMQAEARGERYTPRIDEQLHEVRLLRLAFFGMQEQVHQRQQRIETILNNAAEGIITFDSDGMIESFNNAAEKLFGYSRSEMIGNYITTIIPEISKNEVYNFIQLLLTKNRGNVTRDIELLAKHKDETRFPLSIKISDMELGNKTLYIAMIDDISERKAILENLKHLAEHDSLTGLYNRQFFMEELSRAIAIAHRENSYHSACIYMDLDNFKYINDTLGHMAGDRLLIEISNLISQRTRKSDLLARLGGDEFAMYFYNVTKKQILAIAEEYRQAISNFKFIQDGMTYTAACSLGIAILTPEISDKEELLAHADIACHVAKRNGRNNVHLYELADKERIDNIHTDMGWSQKIKDAIDQDTFVFATQQVRNIATNEIHAHEVLLRMREQDGNLIMPSGFLGSAERFGLVVEVDNWVINHACSLLKKFKMNDPSARFTINLSAKSIGKAEVLEAIQAAIQTYKLQPEDIVFEVTEDVAISDFPNAIQFLNKVRALGCKTALDDFGAGYSSFSYLKEFPVDYVKIDGSFILNIEHDKLNQALVKAMNDVCHTLNKKTIAEFVENDAALKLLTEIGVDYAQGFIIERPHLQQV